MYRGGMFNNRYFRSKDLPFEFYMLAVGIMAVLVSIGTFLVYSRYMFGSNVADINQMLVDNNYYLESSDIVAKTMCKVEVKAAYGSFVSKQYVRRNGRTRRKTAYCYILYLEDDSIMFVKTSSQKERDMLSTISRETINSPDHKSSHSIVLEGTVSEIKIGDVAKKYDEAIDKQGLLNDGSTIKKRYLCIDTSYSRKNLWGRCLIFFVAGFFLITGDAAIYAFKKVRKNKEAARESARQMALENARLEQERSMMPMGGQLDLDEVKRKLHYNYETGEYDLDGNNNDESDASSDSNDGDDGPKFGESERHERTADGKISISGRDLFKD